jgi:chitinase
LWIPGVAQLNSFYPGGSDDSYGPQVRMLAAQGISNYVLLTLLVVDGIVKLKEFEEDFMLNTFSQLLFSYEFQTLLIRNSLPKK